MNKWVKIKRQAPEKTVKTIAGPKTIPASIHVEYHTRECLDYDRAIRFAQQDWVERWPLHCAECCGVGVFHHPGTRWDPPDETACLCLLDSLCPRCGESNPAWEGGSDNPCTNCGWNWGIYQDDAMPPDPECYCWAADDYPGHMSISDGGVKFALYLDSYYPDEECMERLLDIDGAWEVSTDGAQDYKVIFHLTSIDDLTPERIAKARSDIIDAIYKFN